MNAASTSGFDESKHPRHAAGSSQGGQFRVKLDAWEERARDRLTESLSVFGDDGLLEVEIKGDESTVILLPDEVPLLRGRVVSHNHPRDFGFSQSDILLASNARVKEMRAVGPGHTYSMKAPKGWPTASDISMAFRLADNQTYARLRPMVDSKTMTVEEAGLRHYHDVWKKAGRELGLEYRRTRRGSKVAA